jgi:pSer/pThr/pTyr-binding forkhead associated (FHA) protein
MTLVVEVMQPDGTRSRHQLNGAVLTLGRGLANDIVVDDPYVDAAHIRLSLASPGAVAIEDLGSVNGVIAGEERMRGLPIVARVGDVLRVGRTTLRIRDPNEPLPPALVDGTEATPSTRRRYATLARPSVAGLAALVAVSGAIAFNAWLGSANRSSANDAISLALGSVILICVWAGLWSVVSRIVLHRSHFMSHLGVASAVLLASLVWNIGETWLQFFFPDNILATAPSIVVWLGLLAVLIALHLSLSSTLPRKRQWRVGAMVSVVIIGVTWLAALTKDDSFSDVPKFPAVVKPVAARWVPTKSIAQFEDMSRQLKLQVDQLAKK